MVRFMRKCYECATLVEVPKDLYDDNFALCKRHEDHTAIILQFPSSLCNSEEEYSPVEREVAVS